MPAEFVSCPETELMVLWYFLIKIETKPRTTNAFLNAAWSAPAEVVRFYDIPNPYRQDFHVWAINKFIADLKISYLQFYTSITK